MLARLLVTVAIREPAERLAELLIVENAGEAADQRKVSATGYAGRYQPGEKSCRRVGGSVGTGALWLLLKDGQEVRPFVLQESLIGKWMGSRKQDAFVTSLERPYPSSGGDAVARASRAWVWASLPIAIVAWAAFFFTVAVAKG
jgi:hypothetical protein